MSFRHPPIKDPKRAALMKKVCIIILPLLIILDILLIKFVMESVMELGLLWGML